MPDRVQAVGLGDHWNQLPPEGTLLRIDYRCHDHGVVAQGDTTDEERLENCPICGGPIFVAPPDIQLDN
jgi:hypothetical protein